MNEKLFVAILSMDSYNRGYGQSVSGLSSNIGTRIGNASIAAQGTAIDDGFYGIAYSWQGQKVVMYRGSDSFVNYPWDAEGGDAWNGYGIGLGNPYGPQARLAVQFYDEIVGNGANAIVSGHSLGAGLAGLVGSLTGARMVLFDPMPFDQAVSNAYLNAAAGGVITSDGDGGTFVRPFTEQERAFTTRIYGGTIQDGFQPWLPSKAGITGAYIPAASGIPATNLLDSYRNASGNVAAVFGLDSLSLPSDTSLSWSARNKVGQRHANTLIVIRLFADTLGSGNQQWTSAAKYFLPVLFDEEMGVAVGAAAIDATGSDRSGAMQNAIAYSAIDEGFRPFGDTGIRAMFDDAGDLGKAITSGGVALPIPLQDDETKSALGKILVEYAGLLAVNRIFQNQLDVAISGVMTHTPGVALTVDLTDKAWSLHGLLSAPHAVSAKSELVASIMASVDPAIEGQIATWLATTTSNGFTSVEQAVDGIVFFLGGGDAQVPGETGRYRLAVTSNHGVNVPIEFGPAIVLGGAGVDTIIGGYGNDALFGGANTDTLIGRAGNDWFNGGSGSTIVWGDEQGGGGLGQDTVEYSPAPGTYRLTYEGAGGSPYLSVVHSSGTDQLHDVEEVRLGTGQVVLSVNGRIDSDTNLTIYAGSGGVQTIVPRNFGNGITLINDGVPGQSYIQDRATRGEIRLVGFNTQIVGTDYGDELRDYSAEEKIVTAGDGDDIVEVGDGDAIIFGGNGFDQITGGSGDDIILDLDLAHIDAGSGNDTVLLDYGWSDSYQTHSVAGGEGNDDIHLKFAEGIVNLRYARGDGNDIIYNTSFDDIETSQTATTSGSIYQPSFSIQVEGYSASEITATWNIDEIRLIAQDAPNYELSNSWLFRGSITLNFADGGSIFIQSFASTLQQAPGNPANMPVPIPEYLPFDIFIDGSQTPVPLGGSARPASAPVEILDPTIPLASSVSANGDQEVDFKRGNNSYVGGSGNDRLIITMDPTTLIATLSGSDLTVADRWGIIGSTTVSDFDEIYVVAEDQVYTPADFFAAFSNPEVEDFLGTDEDDVLDGGNGNDRFYGSYGDDEINGFGGKDLLDGGSGNDVMSGGDDDDIYYVDSMDDTVVELEDEGRDRVHSSIDFELPDHVEDISLRGEAVAATGNALDNRLTGNGYDNILSGGGGHDSLDGGSGNDILDGGDEADILRGGEGNDILIGAAGDDQMFGDTGDDVMTGGLGNDIYHVDSSYDMVIETAGEGVDTVYASSDFTLPDNVEVLHLQEANGSWPATFGMTSILGGTIHGNSSNNMLAGQDGNDRLFGNDGYDSLTGSGGDDELFGGARSDELLGGDGDDQLLGGAGGDVLDGGEGGDLIIGSGFATFGDIGKSVPREMLEEEGELDIAVYGRPRSDYSITMLDNGWFKVETLSSSETDYLVNVDELHFYDPEDPESGPEIYSLLAPWLVDALEEQALFEDTPFSIEIMDEWFADPNSGALSYSVGLLGGGALPGWLTFDGTHLTGTAPANFNGTFFVELTAHGSSGSVSATLPLEFLAVNDAPHAAVVLEPVEVSSEAPFEFSVPLASFHDVDGDQLTLSARLANGDPLPSWLAFDGAEFSATPPTDIQDIFEIEVIASDGMLTGSATFELSLVSSGAGSLMASRVDESTGHVSVGPQLRLVEPFTEASYVGHFDLAMQWTRRSSRQHLAFDELGDPRHGAFGDTEVSERYAHDSVLCRPRFGDQRMWLHPVGEASDIFAPPGLEASGGAISHSVNRQAALIVQAMSAFDVQLAAGAAMAWHYEVKPPFDLVA